MQIFMVKRETAMKNFPGFALLQGAIWGLVVAIIESSASCKPTTEFAQPRLSRVKGRSSPARGYKFGCVCSDLAGVISHQCNDWPYRNKHIPNLYPLAGDERPLTLLKRGCANSVVGLELADLS